MPRALDDGAADAVPQEPLLEAVAKLCVPLESIGMDQANNANINNDTTVVTTPNVMIKPVLFTPNNDMLKSI